MNHPAGPSGKPGQGPDSAPATATQTGARAIAAAGAEHRRYHSQHAHLAPTFGADQFALRAEAFARFFGTPLFLGAQTVVVAVWIIVNSAGWLHFDVYPFILLNLAFSLQAAYAAPLILLAQTRQAARDKMHAEADAQHREALAVANEQRQLIAAQNATQMLELLEQNTRLTELTKQLTERIEALTVEMHERIRHGLPPSEAQPLGTSAQTHAQTPP
ncbi:DUF1003 domain-containing protein [Acidovorax sp. 1608163]|uniref:DUF1003 domain-containing protein n=1 Tax=Acidovorax sp. 1608163 TaxID=2478662 RepID=UPI000EF725FC|nr:DUF1003 domain-containing protein [Acidovorax sp. 1608163]AYM95847.1 DUF1003 domain-containing protein [Acidovorax sp. 1608163]